MQEYIKGRKVLNVLLENSCLSCYSTHSGVVFLLCDV